MTSVFHSDVNNVVPWNAHYAMPSQSTKAHNQIVQLQPKTGGDYNPGNIIRLEFPSDGYLNALNSTLQFDLDIKPSTPAYKSWYACEALHSLDPVAHPGVSALVFVFPAPYKDAEDGPTNTGAADGPFGTALQSQGYFNGFYAIIQSAKGEFIRPIAQHNVVGTYGVILLDKILPLVDAAEVRVSIVSGVYLQQCGGHEMIQRIRLMYGTLVIEDIHEYAAIARVLSDGGISENYLHSAGAIMDGTHATNHRENLFNNLTHEELGHHQAIVAVHSQKTFCLNLFSGLLTCKKLIPLKWMGAQLQLEITLAPPNKALISLRDPAPTYEWKNVHILAELMDFDVRYDQMFNVGLQQQGVPLKFESWHFHTFNITGSTIVAQIHEKARSIKAVYAVIRSTEPAFGRDYNSFHHNVNAGRQQGTINTSEFAGVGEFQFRLGGKYYPAQPVRCHHGGGEAYQEFLKTMDALGDYTFSSNMSPRDWVSSPSDVFDSRGNKFIMACTFENADIFPDTISGVNGEEQSDINLTIKLDSAYASSTMGKQLHVFVAYDSLLICRPGNVVELVL